jgi:hypothetical protein
MKSSLRTNIAQALLLVMTTASLSGCVTGNTLAIARGDRQDEEKRGVENVNDEPHPGLYALLPLAVAADVALSPVYLLYTLGRFATGHLPY